MRSFRSSLLTLLVLAELPLLASYSFATPRANELSRQLAPNALRTRWSTVRGVRTPFVRVEMMSTPPAFLLQTGESARVLGSPPRAAERRVGVLAQQRQLEPKPVLDLGMVEEFLQKRGKKEIHARVLYKWLFERNRKGTSTPLQHDWTFDTMPGDLPVDLRAALLEEFVPMTSRVVEIAQSDSGGFKLVIQLQDGHLVETVVIRHEHITSSNVRYTVCVSSQVGCAKGCAFCATGTMGFRADLSAGEILEQLWHAQLALKDACGPEAFIRNVVFMGMGEPLANYEEVYLTLRSLTHQCLFDLSARHITVSTVGDSPEYIRRLADDAPRVRLAVSLHSAIQETRNSLMPATVGEEKSLSELADAMDYHRAKSGSVAMIEYLVIHGVNDSKEHADALAQFCTARSQTSSADDGKEHCLLNLIPYNPTEVGSLQGFLSPSTEDIDQFRQYLSVHGVGSLVRWTSAGGRDAQGACGQLVVDASPRARADRLTDTKV